MRYRAVMVDETGCEFSASVTASSREDAAESLSDMYPESLCVQLETPEESREREHELYHEVMSWEY